MAAKFAPILVALIAAPGPLFASCAGLSPGAISSKFSAAVEACDAGERPVAERVAVGELPPNATIAYVAPPRLRLPGRQRLPALRHDATIAQVSTRYRIDPLLLQSIVARESAFKPNAVSPKGALGLMQVMPATARSLGVRDPAAMLRDPTLSLVTGATYLKQMQRKFGNDVPAVLAAYNAGPGAVQRYGRAVPYRETRAYVATIMTRYHSARRGGR